MKKFDNDKVTTYRCKRCHKKIWVPESIIRGMGPVCYGKSYTFKRMIKGGMNREEILKIPKEEIERLAKEELRRYRRKLKRNQKKKPNNKIRMKKVKYKKSKGQKTLDSFLNPKEDKQENVDDKIRKMRKEIHELTYNFSKTNGWGQADKALDLMDEIKKLEESKK